MSDRLEEIEQELKLLEADRLEIAACANFLKKEKASILCPYAVGERIATSKGQLRGKSGWVVEVTAIVPGIVRAYAVECRRVLKDGELSDSVQVVQGYDLQGVARD